MSKKINHKILICLIVLISFALFTKVNAATSNFTQQIHNITECNDGIDNDGDGGIDFATDPDCTSWDDNNESSTEEPSTEPISSPMENTTQEPEETAKPELQQIIETIPKALDKIFSWESIGTILGIYDLQNLPKSAQRSAIILTGLTVIISIFAVVVIIGTIYISVSIRNATKLQNKEKK